MSAAVAGIDGGNSKTDLLLASLAGEPLAVVRGQGSNLAAVGAQACAMAILELLERAGAATPLEAAALFVCGVDLPGDAERVEAAFEQRRPARRLTVRNDGEALLHLADPRAPGAPAAVAVVCGAGCNAVGRAADGRTVSYPTFGPETGYWGGSEMLGREVLFHAARAEDGREEPSGLVDLVRAHFGAPSVLEVGLAVLARRLDASRLGELAPGVLALSTAGDAAAAGLVSRLAHELALLAWQALRDLGLLDRPVEVLLGGGMLAAPGGALAGAVTGKLAKLAPNAVAHRAELVPVVGAGLAALELAGASPSSAARLLERARADPGLSVGR